MSQGSRVRLFTPLGAIDVAINHQSAPATSGSFLAHVDAGLYNGATFYRAARPDNEVLPDTPAQLIQGGLGFAGGSPLPSVTHEPDTVTGLMPVAGAVGLARNEPGTACSEFFICLADNAAMRSGGARGDGLGVAIFGRVVAGLDVARAIQAQPTGREDDVVPRIAWPQLMCRPVMISAATRCD